MAWMSKEQFIITGLGKKTLSGSIAVSGAKNAATKMMAASLLFNDEVMIGNAPQISDMEKMADILTGIGASVHQEKDVVRIDTSACQGTELERDSAEKVRASVAFVGPLLARFGEVTFPHPGGDVIGVRPIDLFLRSFEKMGAVVEVADHSYTLSTKGKKLSGADIFLDIASVGVTETVMMAAVLAEGKTTIRNAAMEPEIESIARYLSSCGARISGIGTKTIIIDGGKMLTASGKVYMTIPDRIEAGSFLILGALAAKKLTVTKCNPTHLRALISILERIGAEIEITDKESITISRGKLQAVDIRTDTYPGFSTDFQSPLVVLLSQAKGESLVFETVFEGRLHYADDLVMMGADIIMLDPHRILVRGPRKLIGRELEGPDIRAGLAYMLAAIVAEGTSIINNVYHIDRGYEQIEKRFSAIGVAIKRVSV